MAIIKDKTMKTTTQPNIKCGVKAHVLIELACYISEVTPAEIMRHTHDKRITFAKYLCYYNLKKYGKLEMVRIAELFGVYTGTIRQGLEGVERIRCKRKLTEPEQRLLHNIAFCDSFIDSLKRQVK